MPQRKSTSTHHPTRGIPLQACKKMLKDQGALRVADNALIAMRVRLEDEIKHITQDSLEYMRHAHRSTILGSDVRMALQRRER